MTHDSAVELLLTSDSLCATFIPSLEVGLATSPKILLDNLFIFVAYSLLLFNVLKVFQKSYNLSPKATGQDVSEFVRLSVCYLTTPKWLNLLS